MVACQWQCTVGRYVEVTLVLRYHSENKCSETRDKRVKQVYEKKQDKENSPFQSYRWKRG